MSLVNGQGQAGAAGLVNSLIPQSSGQAYWWDNRPPPPPPIYSCYRGWDSSHYDQVMGTFMQKPLHADLRSTMCEANCTKIAVADYNATRWCVTLELSEIGPYVYDCLPNISPKITCTDVNRTGSVFLHGRNWTYHCCRATNKEGYPPGTANPEEARCQEKAILISRSFEKAAVVNGSVAGCLEFADRVIYTPLCGTQFACFTSTKVQILTRVWQVLRRVNVTQQHAWDAQCCTSQLAITRGAFHNTLTRTYTNGQKRRLDKSAPQTICRQLSEHPSATATLQESQVF